MDENSIWASHKMSDGTFEVVPSTVFKGVKRWYADYVAQNIQNESAARLMAAAPDLLGCMQLAMVILEAQNAKCTQDTAFILKCRAAIAKAKGGAA